MAAFVIMIGAIWQDALATEELFHGRLLSLFIYDSGQDVSCPSPVSEILFPYPKTLQYLMGHSDISVTMNTYTHLGLEDTVDEVAGTICCRSGPDRISLSGLRAIAVTKAPAGL